MLELLGLLGLVMGGLLVDSLLGGTENRPENDAAAPPDTDQQESGTDNGKWGSVLDWLNQDDDPENPDPKTAAAHDDNPDSSDVEPAAPSGVSVIGTRGDDILHGQAGADTIFGDDGRDQIVGRDGNDWVDAGGDDDHVTAGAGDDTVCGGAGNDDLHGDAGDDHLQGDAGNDKLAGHDGADTLQGGTGDDELQGGTGNDWLTGDQGDDWVAGGDGDDVIFGGPGSDVLDGGSGNDTLIGHDGAASDGAVDYLNAGAGDDILVLGENDVATGDAGHDRFVLGDWLVGGGFAHIQDYNPAEDTIVLIYDPAAHPDPELLLVRDDESDDVTVFFDGMPLAIVQNAAHLTPADIQLDPRGTAGPSAFHSAGLAA